MNAPNKNQIAPITQVRNALSKMDHEFKVALPPHIPVERFTRVALTAVQNNQQLLRCDKTSLLGSIMKCAQDGLLPDGRDAALVIFKSQVQYMPMIGGILKKVRNSGELKTISAHVVYENDEFEYLLGDEEMIKHKPILRGERGKMVAAYAIAHTKDGGIYREVMTREDIEKVRAVSRAKKGPWVDWESEMWKKTPLRRLCKRLPMSTDLDDVIRRDDSMYDLGNESKKAPEGFAPPPAPAQDSVLIEGNAETDEDPLRPPPVDVEHHETQSDGPGDIPEFMDRRGGKNTPAPTSAKNDTKPPKNAGSAPNSNGAHNSQGENLPPPFDQFFDDFKARAQACTSLDDLTGLWSEILPELDIYSESEGNHLFDHYDLCAQEFENNA